MENESQSIMLLQNGNHEAFKNFYESYKTRVYSFIVKMVLSPDEAQEIFQRVFVKVWESRNNINPELSFNAYIYAIARNEVYTYWRRCMSKRQFENYLTVYSEKQFEQMEESIISKDFQTYVSALVELLPQRRKEIFVLRYLKNMSYKEIALQLNVAESTVDNQLQKALHFVRSKMRKEFLLILISLFLPFL